MLILPDLQSLREANYARETQTRESHYERMAELEKQRISFYDRLVLLNGGTLTLVFTATASLQQRQVVLHRWCFVLALLLLVISILTCMLRNRFQVSSLFRFTKAATLRDRTADNEFYIASVKALKLDADDLNTLVTSKDIESELKEDEAAGTLINNAGATLGRVGELTLLLAYMLLIYFFSSNLLDAPRLPIPQGTPAATAR